MATKKKREPKEVSEMRPVVSEVAKELAPDPIYATISANLSTFPRQNVLCETHTFKHRSTRCVDCGAERTR